MKGEEDRNINEPTEWFGPALTPDNSTHGFSVQSILCKCSALSQDSKQNEVLKRQGHKVMVYTISELKKKVWKEKAPLIFADNHTFLPFCN